MYPESSSPLGMAACAVRRHNRSLSFHKQSSTRVLTGINNSITGNTHVGNFAELQYKKMQAALEIYVAAGIDRSLLTMHSLRLSIPNMVRMLHPSID